MTPAPGRKHGKNTGWTNKQKGLAVRACKSVGIDDDQRRLILRQLGGHAVPRRGAEPTSTSPKLTQGDFEKFMACVESYADDGQLLGKPAGYWEDRFINGDLGRLLYKARQLQHALMDAGQSPGGAIAKAIGREYDTLHDLDQDELRKAIDAMTALTRRGAA